MFISTHIRSKLANKKWCINIPRWRSKARTSNTERRRHKEVMKAKSRANEFSRCRGESGKGSGWEGHPESRRNFTSQRDKSKKASALLNERAQVVVYLVAKTMPKMADQINSSLFSFVVRTNLCRCMSRVILKLYLILYKCIMQPLCGKNDVFVRFRANGTAIPVQSLCDGR